ncbi:unnamed protein product (macronuclear) [Paramecium tetraurelia]|uniref:Uncharacterized protein n=1 Tax=Paramecium tetraurelia TaxID=5888 RepID=A0C6D1_PARTE|nr:uncharacterized protein GSPATT00035477001 [Paramecium tetraurelia]CAK66348.1 unnamed protein product [Paramecium tetraurelia]|eukprot:XP_001433745.1 hypothetical protein (macronuclear) [Paramecium tetraurelia strain d4-2]
MLKLHKREELKEVLSRRSSLHHELSKLQRSALMQLNNHTTQELQSNQKAPGGSPAHIRINLQQFALPKIQHTTKVITNKYIGEYNNMLGIITSKHQIPSRDCTQRSASQYHNPEQFIENQNYVINQFIRPRKLGSFR